MEKEFRYLAQFLGPKSENGQQLKSLIDSIVSDHNHWRKNYFSDDEQLISPADKRDLYPESDELLKRTQELIANLRRSFPIYSPRYIGHQHSDTTMASLAGLLAGTLYNANNVTPESGVVTVDLELDCCNELLSMVGFGVPPNPPKHASEFKDYREKLEGEFGWCHLTSGGTIANIEALWVARIVKYFPLAVHDACKSNNISLDVKLPNGNRRELRSLTRHQVLAIRPNESIYLLARFVEAVSRKFSLQIEASSDKAWDLIRASKYSPSRGFAKQMNDFPPVIFVSGAAHYSIAKAADILGLGRECVELVDLDSRFRIDTKKLESKIVKALKEKRAVLGVIAIAGTTEEGAVDSLDEILTLRSKLERGNDRITNSFWLHVDAAWGGYFRSLFNGKKLYPETLVSKQLFSQRVKALHDDVFSKPPYAFQTDLNPAVDTREYLKFLFSELNRLKEKSRSKAARKIARVSDDTIDGWFSHADQKENYKFFLNSLHEYLREFRECRSSSLFKISVHDRVADVQSFCSDEILVEFDTFRVSKPVQWPADSDVGKSIFLMKCADSVTIDPHKMGYTPYPCGAIAFRNDRVRHFIRQEAPYITSERQHSLVHKPIRTASEPTSAMDRPRISTEAFASYTLEGSRPSSAACSLHLQTKAMPLDQENHGEVIRSSVIATRHLYEWIKNWNSINDVTSDQKRYETVLFSPQPPDTNLVVFGVKGYGNHSIGAFNELNEIVYRKFSISSELGQREYSYSQPFFLSKTTFNIKHYPADALRSFFERSGFKNYQSDYKKSGIFVLRATVMNPYILPLIKSRGQNLFEEFMRELHRSVIAAQDEIADRTRANRNR